MDQLIVVDGMPTVFEVKVSRMWGLTQDLKHSMSEERIDHVFVPLKEYFGFERYGYSVVTNSNKIKPELSKVQADFEEKGRILVPLYLGSHEHKSETKRIKEETGL